MPAKSLSPDQLQDAARLKIAFKQWQAARKAVGLVASQDAVAGELFGFGQSALSQYLNGTIPLNADALAKFASVLNILPGAISPSIDREQREQAARWLGVTATKGAHSNDGSKTVQRIGARPLGAIRQVTKLAGSRINGTAGHDAAKTTQSITKKSGK